MDKMPLNIPRVDIPAKEPINPAQQPATRSTHPPVTREEGGRSSLFEQAGNATMAGAIRAVPPGYAATAQMDDTEAANRAAIELIYQARESYFRQAPQAERDQHEESMRCARALTVDAGARAGDVVSEFTALLNQARDAYFSNAPQAERDEHEQSMQRLRSMSDAEIAAELSQLAAQYSPKV